MAKVGHTQAPRDTSRRRRRVFDITHQATGSSALVADVLSFSLRISFVLVLVGYIASGMFQYWSTFELEQYNERHLKLT